MQENKWNNCYDEGWQGVIVPEAFSHPAKMAYGLLKRILEHAKIQGWLKEGDVIVDPFGGIGSTGILGAYEGYQVVCVELEQKFVELAKKNFEIHKDAWVEFGHPFPVILQGDSRQLCQIVEKADCIVSSPPYVESMTGQNPGTGEKAAQKRYERLKTAGYDADGMMTPGRRKHNLGTLEHYGKTPGQLGSMKPGKVDMVVSSPPYAESEIASETNMSKQARIKARKEGSWEGYNRTNPKNLGNLKSGDVDAIISSPPYEGSFDHSKNAGRAENTKRRKKKMEYGGLASYSDNDKQLGNYKGDTFWQAAKEIVQQCYQILKPGGHAIWVVKSFVRNKKIVDFPGDWQKLCESVGFKTVCVHHAMLVKETKHQTLFGDTEVKRKERKSFFRRLAESKGSPRIDYEVVLCMSKE